MKKEIDEMARSKGIAKVGFAELDDSFLSGDLKVKAAGMDHAVVLLVPLTAPLAYGTESKDVYHAAMVQARSKMDCIAEDVAVLLRSHGHKALSVTSVYKSDPSTISGQISHRSMAYRAGLGWIGKSTLLVTPEFGPKVRLITILTDAALGPDQGPMSSQCGECRICIDRCPMNALKMKDAETPSDRASSIDYVKCDRYEKATLAREPPSFCAMCVRSCPVGQER